MNFPHLPPPRPGRTPPARTGVVYDSVASGVRGKGFCDQLAGALDGRSGRREALWHRDLPGAPRIGKAAGTAGLDFFACTAGPDGLPAARRMDDSSLTVAAREAPIRWGPER